MPDVAANGIDIYYEMFGADRTGTPLVLTHGFAGPFRQWVPEVLPLAEDRPLLLYDVRGHDRSTVPPDTAAYSLPVLAADLSGLLSVLGIGRAHIGGVSMGGLVTAQFAVDYPDVCASLLLCDTTCGNTASDDPAGLWENRMRVGMGALSHMVQTYGLEETVLREEEWKKVNDAHRDVSPYSLEDDLDRIKLMTVEGYAGAAHAIVTRPDLSTRMSSVTAPTLVMIGEWDDFLPCALRDHETITGSRLVVRERCGHGSRWRAETFVDEIRAFLADVDAGRAVAGEKRI